MILSIITCTFNSEKYLQETINSVINQNLNSNDYEHIFIDWFSTDDTINIIKEYIKNNADNKIILKQYQAKWIYNAMNKWVKLAKWEYITFLNSDDYYNNNALKDYLNFVNNDWNKDLYYWINNVVNSNWKKLHEYPNRAIYKKWLNRYILSMACYIFQSSTLYKKELHNKYWLYNENLKLVSDGEFFIKLAKWNITNTFYNKVIANFRMHDWSASNSTRLQMNENEKIRINIFWKIVWTIMNYCFKIIKFILVK